MGSFGNLDICFFWCYHMCFCRMIIKPDLSCESLVFCFLLRLSSSILIGGGQRGCAEDSVWTVGLNFVIRFLCVYLYENTYAYVFID